MKLLHIETSEVNCSVALTDNDTILATKAQNIGHFTHSENLHLFIETVITTAGVPPSSLDTITVNAGADSYTGLCIGVTTAKGLYSALGKPLVSIPILQILTHQVAAGCIIPMFDAHHMEVYNTAFDSEYRFISPTETKVLDTSSYEEHLNKGKVTFLGDGSTKFAAICQHPNATSIVGAFPEAKGMTPFAIEKYGTTDFEDITYFEPTYLK